MTRKAFIIIVGVLFAGGFALGCGGKKDEKGGKIVKTNGDKPTPTNGTGPTTAPRSDGYKETAVENGGKIAGTITYTGDKTSEPLKVTKDPEVCTHGGKPDGSIVVAEGKLKNAIVYLTGITEGKKWDDGHPTLDNRECVYVPRVAIVKHRGAVTAKNSDPVLHNVKMVLQEGNKTLHNFALPTQGQTEDKEIKKEGLVAVSCDVHEWMKAFVLSSPHPYAAVTADDGTFEIADIPPGEYTVKVWHEVLGETEQKVKVEGGAAATLDHEFK